MITLLATPCREWQGKLSSAGYGEKYSPDTQRMVLMHRWVVAQIDGWEAIEGRVVMHMCDNPACYRYSHLRIGTHSDNMLDMHAKRRGNNSRKETCPQGHPYDREMVRTSGSQAGRRYRRCSICLKDQWTRQNERQRKKRKVRA